MVNEAVFVIHTCCMATSPVQAEDLEETLHSIERQFDGQPRRLRFVMVGLRELSRVASDLSEEQLRQLSGGDKFPYVLVEWLSDRLPAMADPLARARTRGMIAQRQMLAVEGPPMGVSQVAEHLHISRQAVDKRRRTRKLETTRRPRRPTELRRRLRTLPPLVQGNP